MQWRVYDQRFPWVVWAPAPQGGYRVADRRTGQSAYAPNWNGVVQFAADHSSQSGTFGFGDMVHAATNAVGMKRCTPCAQRQAEMNQWGGLPQSWNPFS